MIIAIDGPGGSGKSSVAKRISEILNFEYIDTGAMYRLLALKLKRENKEFYSEVLDNLNIRLENNKFYLDSEDVTNKIRENEISILASKFSKLREVRDFMVNKQREISKGRNIILDGRDIGTFVFPNADIKFYLTASSEIRAKRRFLESKDISYETILADIIKRDEQDMNREYAPLKKADDAIEINTDELNLEEVIAEMLKVIKEKM